MSRKAKYLWSVGIAATLLVGGVAWFYLSRAEQEKTQQYLNLAETYTIAFSDRAALYLSRGNPEDLNLLANTASTLLFGNVILFVQTISNSEVVVDVRTTAGNALDLPVITPENSVSSQTRHLDDGTPYVDVVKLLFPLKTQDQTPVQGYVRIGSSLSQLQAELLSDRLSTVGIGFAVWAVIMLGAWLSLKWLFLTQPTTQAVTESGLSATQEPSPDTKTLSEDVSETVSSLRRIGELALDDAKKYVEVRGEPIELSPKEFDLLKLLCQEPGKVYSNDEILKDIWAEHSFASAQDVKQYIYFLRRKLEEDPKEPKIIVTVRGFGYKIEA